MDNITVVESSNHRRIHYSRHENIHDSYVVRAL